MSFSHSSNNIELVGASLRASCRTIAGEYYDNELNLDHHVGNHDGVLTFGSGGFSQTSQNIYLSGATLHAECRRVDGSYVSSQLNLDHHIGNIDGVLTAN